MNKTKFVIWAMILFGILAYKEVSGNSGYERQSGYVYKSTVQER